MEISKHAATPVTTYPPQVSPGDIQPGVLEAPALDPETRSRLMQLGNPMRHAARAASARAALVVQLKDQGLGTLGPPHTDILADPAALEEFNRKKNKETTLASSLRVALNDSLRTQAELKSALTFLLPKIAPGLMPDKDVASGKPGSQPLMQNPADSEVSGLVWNSHAEFFAQIGELLEVLKTEWLSKYQDALATFLEFYRELADIMEEIQVTAVGDKGDVKIEFGPITERLRDLMDRYRFFDGDALATFSSEEAAESFKTSLGLPGLSVVARPDGTFGVMMDIKPVQDLILSMPLTARWNAAEYNAWVSSKDSNMEQIKHVSKVLGEKLNEMTQKYDNIVKILSSSIDKMSEANKAYVHNT